MPSLITPRELTKWVPGKVLSASDALGWKDVGQRTYRYVGQDVAVRGIDHFTIVRYCVGATRMERRFDGRWTRTHCAPGDLSLLTRSQGSHWHWTEDIDVSHVYLSEQALAQWTRRRSCLKEGMLVSSRAPMRLSVFGRKLDSWLQGRSL